ncbi:hypothetical protein ACIUZJ_29915 [Pseudomonas aeruginosa]|nr:hypothetical protein [Pseudomonas aeruginosa]
MPSPFKKYRDILLGADYGVAISLQQFVLSLYNSASTKFEADRLGSYDPKHLGIFFELASSYNQHGENDPEFMQLCRDMWDMRKQWGRKHLERVEEHKQINPKAYDEGERAWHEEMRWLDERTEAYQAKGWIER